ncbi:MAG: hypothetical protein R2834_19035 [Rhodothermales bacterium]
MEALIQAAVDIHDATLRYAEIERSGASFRLLKLGSCEFDFDMMRELSNGAQSVYLDTLSEALHDVFAQTEASDLHVVLHPPHCYSFFTPLLVDMNEEERKGRLQEEATMLTSGDSPMPLHLTADVVFTESLASGKTVEWFHVLGMRELLHSRFDRILRTLPHRRYRFNLSTRGAARVIESLQSGPRYESADRTAFSLAVGFYERHVEYTICRQHRWYYSHYAEAGAPADAVYYALALLKRLQVPRASVRDLFTYGSGPHHAEAISLLSDVFQTPCLPLNPIDVVELEGRRPGDGFAAEAYAPCIGAAL